MRKITTTLILALVVLAGSSAYVFKTSTGVAGYTGSPGEATCGTFGCHGGGSSAVSGITITSSPAFSLNANSQYEYLPDSTYQIKIEASASGYTRYGFGSEILDASNANSGTIQNPGSGVKFLNALGRRNAVHTTPKIAASGTATFTYRWVAPSAGAGDATIYAISNAVNNNGNTSGDFVISPVNLPLVEGTPPPPPPDTTGLSESTAVVSQVSVFPNPASDLTAISYFLLTSGNINIQLIDIKGNLVKQLYSQQESPGYHTQLLDLNGVASGVYFVKTSAGQQKVSQKLITVQ